MRADRSTSATNRIRPMVMVLWVVMVLQQTTMPPYREWAAVKQRMASNLRSSVCRVSGTPTPFQAWVIDRPLSMVNGRDGTMRCTSAAGHKHIDAATQRPCRSYLSTSCESDTGSVPDAAWRSQPVLTLCPVPGICALR